MRLNRSVYPIVQLSAAKPFAQNAVHAPYAGHGMVQARQWATMKSRWEVVEMVRRSIRLRHYSLRTEDAYCHWVGRYYDFCAPRSRQEKPEAKAECFLTRLALRSASAKTQNQAMSALLFLYKEVLHKPLGAIDALRAKRPQHERVSPDREQISAFRSMLKDTAHTPAKLLVDLIYGCGLRVCEPLDLRTQDILWGERQLVIRGAKGFKDRRVPIPVSCVEPLRRQLEQARSVWTEDQALRTKVGVPLPHRLAYKYPAAPFSWQWFWVFPAPGHCRDPLTQQTVRFRLLEDSLQRVVHEASVAAGLGQLISPHVLRHAYATHSREPIETLRQLMGHASIVTTSGYRHTTIQGASNPLDDLLREPPRCGTATNPPPAPVNLFLNLETTGGHCPEAGPHGAPVRNAEMPPEDLRPSYSDRARIRWKYRPLQRNNES